MVDSRLQTQGSGVWQDLYAFVYRNLRAQGLSHADAEDLAAFDYPEEDLLAYLEAILRVYNLFGRRDNGSAFTLGVEGGTLNALKRLDSRICHQFPSPQPRAPSRSVLSSSRTISSRSNVRLIPRPSQASQAPYGELNENIRGASSGTEIPQSAQDR